MARMTNMYGETVKPQYEVAIQRHVEGSVADDFESIDFVDASNYRDAVKRAKDLSLKYNDTTKNRIKIVCYFRDDTSDYNQVWDEVYVKGKKEGRYEF